MRAESITTQLQHPRLQFVALRVVSHPRGEAREDGEHLGAEGVVGAEGRFAEAELVVEQGFALLAGRVLVVAHQEHLHTHMGNVGVTTWDGRWVVSRDPRTCALTKCEHSVEMWSAPSCWL